MILLLCYNVASFKKNIHDVYVWYHKIYKPQESRHTRCIQQRKKN